MCVPELTNADPFGTGLLKYMLCLFLTGVIKCGCRESLETLPDPGTRCGLCSDEDDNLVCGQPLTTYVAVYTVRDGKWSSEIAGYFLRDGECTGRIVWANVSSFFIMKN